MPNLNHIAVYFLPELILLVGAVAILTVDLVAHGRRAPSVPLAIGTLLAAITATLWLYTVPPPAAEPVTLSTVGGLTAACGSHAIFEARGPSIAGEMGAVVRCGAFSADGFTQFFRLFGLITALLVTLSGSRFIGRRSASSAEFFSILLFAAMAMSLMAGATDLVLMALAIEFLSLCSYILTAFLRGEPLATEAGLKYFLYGSTTSAAMLMGMSLLFGLAGSTSVPLVAAALNQVQAAPAGAAPVAALMALALVLVGFSFKIDLVPFHQWSPDAYEGAAAPVTAFLSVGPKLAGFAVLLRLLMAVYPADEYAPVWTSMLGLLAVLTMVVGNVVALVQDNVKRMLAYSSIAQAGFMLVGLAAWMRPGGQQADSLAAVLVYLLAYVFTNLGAFAVVIAVDDDHGSSEVSAYAGLMRRSPLLAVALAVFFLSLLGIPPLAGFIGKFTVFRAAVIGNQLGLAVIGVLTGVISVGYYFRVLREAFLRPAAQGAGRLVVAPGLRMVIVSALVMTLLIGLFAGPFLDFAAGAAASIAPTAARLPGGS